MFHHQTQTEQYWTQELSIDSDDLDYIHNLLLEEEHPLLIQNLTLAVVRHRVEQEEHALQRLLAKGSLYKPENDYRIGEKLVFPAFNFATAIVTATRAGYNPEFGEFQVIKVEFSRTGRAREFASKLDKAHQLNQETDKLLQEDATLKTAEELYQQYGKWVQKELLAALENQRDLIQLFGLWFLKALTTEVGLGYLNIAEAILDIADGGPRSTPELLQDMELPSESQPELLEFSVNYALYQDERFDEVGPAGQVLWYLRRLEPPTVLYPPKRLVYTPTAYNHELLNPNLRRLEQELDDEWSHGWEPAAKPERVSFTLTFPHWQQGTAPLTSKIAPLFPTSYQAPHIRCTFIDNRTDQEMDAWVVWKGRFVYGLGNFYKENDLPIGTYIHLWPGPVPGVVMVEFEAHRPQSEWLRVAQVGNGELYFGMQKRVVGCAYDDMMMVGLDDPAAPDPVWIRVEESRVPLAHLMVKLFPELAKLSPQSTVHAKTIYSVVNMVRRCPPGPIFAELVRQPCFISMGENYWRLNPSLWSGR